jgi:hypothetical protein
MSGSNIITYHKNELLNNCARLCMYLCKLTNFLPWKFCSFVIFDGAKVKHYSTSMSCWDYWMVFPLILWEDIIVICSKCYLL